MVCDKNKKNGKKFHTPVLILLFLEYGLRPFSKNGLTPIIHSLNPTFSGIWSATISTGTDQSFTTMVLILLFLEYGLRRWMIQQIVVDYIVLILLFLEYGLRQVLIQYQIRILVVLILLFLEYGLRQERL